MQSFLGGRGTAAGAYPAAPSASPRPAEPVADLRRRLAGEAAEREAVEVTLRRTRQLAEAACDQLASTVDDQRGGEALVARVQEILRALEEDVRGASQARPASPRPDPAAARVGSAPQPAAGATGGYAVLRQSLQAAQRRCEQLSGELQHQTSTSRDLEQALGFAKDANERLLEQIRTQGEDVTRLAAQRAADEERLGELARRQRSEREEFDTHAQQAVTATLEATRERCGRLCKRLADKVRLVHERLRSAKDEVDWLRRQQRSELRDSLEAVRQLMQSAEESLRLKVVAHAQATARKREEVQPLVDELGAELERESAMRRQDAEDRARRQKILMVEREDLQARSSRELSALSSRLQAAERALAGERSASASAQECRDRELSALMAQRGDCESALEQAKRDIIRLESLDVNTLSEVQRRTTQLEELQRQVRESSDALAAATSGNEHLHTQLADHAQRAQEACDADVSQWKAAKETELREASAAHEVDMAAGARQLASEEEELNAHRAVASRLRAQIEDVDREVTTLDGELASWKTKCEAANVSRKGLEAELADARKEFQREKLKLQLAMSQHRPRIAAAETEAHDAAQRLADQRRRMLTQDTEQTSRANALQSLLQSAQAQLGEAKARLSEVSMAWEQAASEAAQDRERADQGKASLEAELARRKREAEEELRYIEGQANAAQEEARSSIAQVEQWKGAQEESYLHIQEECELKASQLTQERERVEEAHRVEMARLDAEAAEQGRRRSILQQEIVHLKRLLSESEANLDWVRQERRREEREQAMLRDRLEEELREATKSLNVLMGSGASVQGQLRAADVQQKVQRVAKEIEGLKRRLPQEQADADARLQQAKQQHQARLHLMEASHSDLLDQSRQRLEGLLRERDRARQSAPLA